MSEQSEAARMNGTSPSACSHKWRKVGPRSEWCRRCGSLRFSYGDGDEYRKGNKDAVSKRIIYKPYDGRTRKVRLPMKVECEHGLDTRLPCGDCQKAYEAENVPSLDSSPPVCSVIPDWIVESGLGQFGIRETNDDCRVIARCDTFKDAMRIAKLLNAETPNAQGHGSVTRKEDV